MINRELLNPTGKVSFVTFHQSYGYEEFVEGLRPMPPHPEDSGDVKYHIRKGPFLVMCERAENNKEDCFAIVIDEINRGNISKIFGELITLIETDKRMFVSDPNHELNGTNALCITLPYSGDQFSVPPNLSIIGTMNTADRSLALLDTALRRRFDFREMMPDTTLLANLEIKGINVRDMLVTINRRIVALYDREHSIGHAYFLGLKNIKNEEERFAELGNIFRNRIIPLLQEYFFDDWEKIRMVLGDGNKLESRHQFITTEEVTVDALFGKKGGDNLDWIDNKVIFQVNPLNPFSCPESYIGIYQN